MKQVKVIDSTLRDGEQKAGIALSVIKKVKIAAILDEMGVDQIEAGTPAMGGEEARAVKEIGRLGLRAVISCWNRMHKEDLDRAMEAGVQVVHISAPVSAVQIRTKLRKEEGWVKANLEECIDYVRTQGFVVHVGMEDASRADIRFLEEICQLAKGAGASMVRYADTVGVASPLQVRETISHLTKRTGATLGFHGHNDLGMALANTLVAAESGAGYVDCTIGGIGERAGNCDYTVYIQQAVRMGIYGEAPLPAAGLKKMEKEILKIVFQ